jgi:hypothetical protein
VKTIRVFAAAALALALASAVACSSSDPGASSGGSSSGSTSSSSSSSSSSSGASGSSGDAGGDGRAPADGGAADGGDDILGTLVGACPLVAPMIAAATPAIENDSLVFVAGETYAKSELSPGGQKLFDTANAGGSSTESEVMSYEVLRACAGAKLLKTETEIGYEPPSDAAPNSITDILMEIGGKKVGVSVTRAYKPPAIPLTDADVQSLLVKKLEGINRSSERVLPADKWVKQILHVFAVDQNAADAVNRVWATLDASLKADTVVLVTRTKGGGFIYCNPDPPLGSECP